MGQYYKAVFLTENNKPKNYVYSHDFGSGLKLMEHSWMKNDFVRFVEKQLMIEPQKIVWAGDYADKESPTTITKEEIKVLADEKSDYWNSEKLKAEGINLYSLADTVSKLTHNERVENKYNHEFKSTTLAPLTAKYLVNYTKNEFVDKSKAPKSADDWRVHPLPLLTCEGNGRGGGDFRGENPYIGAWSRDKIGVVSNKSDIPKGFTEITPNFAE